MLNHQSPAARRLLSIQTPQPSLRLRSGGLVQGPGTSTSDSIPAKLSDGEFVLPADTVRKVGIKSLRDLVQRTHEPSGRQPRPGHFADGGIADDELRQRQNSFGDAAAAASNPALQQVTPPPAAPSAAPSPTNIFPGNRLPDGAGRTSSAQAPGLAPVPTPATADAPSVTERERLINQIPTDSYPNGPKPDGSMDNPLNSETGRNLQAIANSVAGLGGAVPALTKTGGAISSFLNSSAGAVRGAASVIPAAGGVATAASLMQMAKTNAALTRFAKKGLPYISVLTDPTMGGVSAGFAFLGDIVMAEPNALIGFAGPRVIENTVRVKLPEGFQRAEFLQQKGGVDMIVDRRELRDRISSSLAMLQRLPADAVA